MADQVNSLVSAPAAVFRIWRRREQIEVEAASLFDSLGDQLFHLYGADDVVGKMAKVSAEDEIRHAKMCQEILSHGPTYYEPLAIPKPMAIGPQELSPHQKVIYWCVAISCVTETLSTGLLMEMHKKANPGIIKETIHEILTDEITHSRLGWAELTRVRKNQNLSWVGPYIPAMIKEALSNDITPMLDEDSRIMDLSPWGILPEEEAKHIMETTLNEVIYPGLDQLGIVPHLSAGHLFEEKAVGHLINS